jgi:hypothetical protein
MVVSPFYWIWKFDGGKPELMATLVTEMSRSRLRWRNF